MEDIRYYKNRRYCSRVCADEALHQRARDFYEAHKDEIRAKKKLFMKKLRDANPGKYREISRKAKAKERESLFEMYGHACAVCGISDKRALTLDHVQKNGNKERKEHGERGVYRKALSEYRPDLYRTLCMNCQFIKKFRNNELKRGGQ